MELGIDETKTPMSGNVKKSAARGPHESSLLGLDIKNLKKRGQQQKHGIIISGSNEKIKSDSSDPKKKLPNTKGTAIKSDTLSHTKPSTSKDEAIKFSSRNSLRQTSTKPHSGGTKDTTLKEKRNPTSQIMTSDPRAVRDDSFKRIKMKDLNLSDVSKYVKLSSECFTRVIGTYIYCLLCGKRERMQDSTSLQYHNGSRTHTERFWELKKRIVDIPPDVNSLHMRYLNLLLDDWTYQYSLDETMIENRYIVMSEFFKFLQILYPDCSCRVIGSFATGASLKTSDVNLELIHPNSHLFDVDPRAKDSVHHKLTDPDAKYGEQFNNHTIHYDLIPNAIDTLYKIGIAIESGHYPSELQVISYMNDLNSKHPKLRLMHRLYQIRLEITCYAESSHKMAALLRTYLNLDERAKILSILVKHWASQCRISSPPGTFAPETFVILVIYFLQRTDPPILPCLHEISNKQSTKHRPNGNKSTPNTDEHDFVNKFERLLLSNGSGCATENEKMLGRRSNCPDDPNELTNSSQDRAEEDPYEENDEYFFELDLDTCDLNWTSENTSHTHTLFIEFMLYMFREFSDCSTVISIRSLQTLKLTAKPWNTQVKGIENPIKPLNNLSRVIGSQRVYNYIRECFRYAYYYMTSIPLSLDLKPVPFFRDDPRELIHLYANINQLEFYFNMKEPKMKGHGNFIDEMVQQNLFARDVQVINNLLEHTKKKKLDDLLKILVRNFNDKMLVPPDSTTATRFCWLCKKCGHIREGCPDGKINSLMDTTSDDPMIDTVMNLDPYFLEMYNKDIITEEISNTHHRIVEELEQIIKSGLDIRCTLTLFGSTVNCLGSFDSDLDICLTFDGNDTGLNVDCVGTLERVHDILIELDQVEDMEPILSARVPILKFKYKRYDIDLSMYNQCAIYNSRLLKAYSQVDCRLPQLFFLVKKYAKACGIADASRGSLSSYAWTLLVIHFLQKTEPPILPVLQELQTDSRSGMQMFGVNGWNVWFNEDIASIRQPYNDTNLTQLLKSFFVYYSKFDFELNVVSIRTKDLITRFQKNWINCLIAIEDPFELTYNISGRLDDLMALYILRSFNDAFNTIVKFQKDAFRWRNLVTTKKVESIFDGYKITGQKNPPYRGCRLCHRIGHRVANCPEKGRQVDKSRGRVKQF